MTRDLTVELNEVLSKSAADVYERAKQQLVEAELDRRAKLVVDATLKLQQAREAVEKVKPDAKVFDADGKVLSEGYSAAKRAERQKAADAVKRLEEALDAALLSPPKYEKLKQAVAGKPVEVGSENAGSGD